MHIVVWHNAKNISHSLLGLSLQSPIKKPIKNKENFLGKLVAALLLNLITVMNIIKGSQIWGLC
jgi:hypothetical protein